MLECRDHKRMRECATSHMNIHTCIHKTWTIWKCGCHLLYTCIHKASYTCVHKASYTCKHKASYACIHKTSYTCIHKASDVKKPVSPTSTYMHTNTDTYACTHTHTHTKLTSGFRKRMTSACAGSSIFISFTVAISFCMFGEYFWQNLSALCVCVCVCEEYPCQTAMHAYVQ